MNKIELDIVALSHSVTQSHNYAVILSEINGRRKLPIVIGGFEAQAIAVAIEQMAPNRPLTHDLFKNTLEVFKIDLKEVVINNLLDGVFYAKLVCIKNDQEYEIDARTSDAIAMAVRFGCPIYAFDFIIEAAGVEMEEGAEKEESLLRKNPSDSNVKIDQYNQMSAAVLKKLLADVVAKEDYEKAAKIRDELKKRGES
ncbi:MAG: bifunctional nuclease domain-containing protein [Saprospiraceae bacterium]